jgi:hypothetical protein
LLAHFPKPYPGEILYSVLARLWEHLGRPKERYFAEITYGRREIPASVHFPRYLDALAGWAPFNAIKAERAIDELTLYNYYAAFEPAKFRAALRRSMRAARPGNFRGRTGLHSLAVGLQPGLRYCPCCLAEMIDRKEEPHWLREHQLPGVIVCRRHRCSLSICPLDKQAVFTPASLEVCLMDAPPIVPGDYWDVMPHLVRIAERSFDLLANLGAPRALKEWGMHYREELKATGLVKFEFEINEEQLDKRLLNFYGRALELLPSVIDQTSLRGRWLTYLTTHHDRAVHPLYHVLLGDFLAQKEMHGAPFGAGPWPCQRELCAANEPFPVKTYTWHTTTTNERYAVFACRCGRSFTRTFDAATGLVGPRTYFMHASIDNAPPSKALDAGPGTLPGNDRMERIRRAIEECGGSRSAAAARLGMNRSTLWRLLKEDTIQA